METYHRNVTRRWALTLLDLLDHPTIIFYSTGYSLFSIWQASRRGYRLNQKKECRVFYMSYKGTLQDDCLQIMASKKVATAAIQGSFSAEGLAAMAQGVDPQVMLAQALCEGSDVKDSEIEAMFNRINEYNTSASELSAEDRDFLLSLQTESSENSEEDQVDIFHVIPANAPAADDYNSQVAAATNSSISTHDLLKDFFDLVNFASGAPLSDTSSDRPSIITVNVKKRPKASKVSDSQMGFNF